KYAMTSGDDAANVILSVTEDQAEAFATATLRSAVAGHSLFSSRLNHRSCRTLEGESLAAHTDFFSDDRSILGMYTQAAYEFYLVQPLRVNPYDPSSYQWNSCGCLSLDNLCYVDINNLMTRATYSKYNGWGEGGVEGIQNTSMVHPRAFIMSNFSDLVGLLTRQVPIRWGSKIPLVLDNVSSVGRGNLPLTLLPHAVCVEWNSTNNCVRAHIIEVRIDAILGEALRQGATSSTSDNYVGLYDVSVYIQLTALMPLSNPTGNPGMLDSALRSFMSLCATGPGNFSSRCPSRRIEVMGDYISSATLITIGQHDDFSLVFVEITPKSDYYGQIRDLGTMGFGFGLGAVGIVVVIFLMNAFCVAASFRRLARDIRHLATISPNSVQEGGAVESARFIIPEVRELHEAFLSLRNKVRNLRRFIPQGVLDDPLDFELRGNIGGGNDAGSPNGDAESSYSASSATMPEYQPVGSATEKRFLRLHTQLPRVTGAGDFTKQVSFPNVHRKVAVSTAAAKRTGMMLSPNRYVSRTGTILVISVAIPSSIDQEELEGMLSHIMDEIITATSEHGGTIEVLRPDHIVVCFNAEGRHSQAWLHATAASDCALDIIESLPEYLRSMIVCALDSGEYWIGSCGSNQRLSRAIFGPRLQTCEQLAILSSVALGSKIVLSDRTAAFLSSQRITFPVDMVSFTSGDIQGTKLLVHELPLPSLLQEQPAQLVHKDKNAYRDAFSALIDGRLVEAQKALHSITCPPFAAHAKRLLKYSNVLMDSTASRATHTTMAANAMASSRSSACNALCHAYVRPQTSSWDMFGTNRQQQNQRSTSMGAMLQSFESGDGVHVTESSTTNRLSQTGSTPKLRAAQNSGNRPPTIDDRESLQHSNMGSLPGSDSVHKRLMLGPAQRGGAAASVSRSTPTEFSTTTASTTTKSAMQPDLPISLPQHQQQSSTATIVAVDPATTFHDADGVLWHRAQAAIGQSVAHNSQLYVVVSSNTGALLCAKALWLGSPVNVMDVHEEDEPSITATRRTALSRRILHLALEAISSTMELQSTHAHENLIRSHPIAAVGAAENDDAATQWFVYVCDFMSLGSVLDVQRKFGYIPFSAVRRHASDILRGLTHLHSLVQRADDIEDDTGAHHPVAANPMDMLLNADGNDEFGAGIPPPSTPVRVITSRASQVHGNLRTCNVLIGADGACKLSDYGPHFFMESYLQRLWSRLHTAANEHGDSLRYGVFKECPVVPYAAPELLVPYVAGTWKPGDSSASRLASLTTPASDVFSFGVVLYEIVTKSLPWSRADSTGRMSPLNENTIRNDAMALQLRVATMQRALDANAAPFPTPCTIYVDPELIQQSLGSAVASGTQEHITDIITSCLQMKPEDRPSASTLAQHPLFLMW
ncbi:protein kinase, putative, partial [Bodo saltans]